jgi:hypothetical protein
MNAEYVTVIGVDAVLGMYFEYRFHYLESGFGEMVAEVGIAQIVQRPQRW